MMQKVTLGIALGALFAVSPAVTLTAADRSTCFVPRAADDSAEEPATGETPDRAFADPNDPSWQAYRRLWRAHHDDPADTGIRRFLGLPLKEAVDAQPRRGRSAPKWLGWRLGSYQQFDTPHFTIYSRADATAGRQMALDLERCYWIWTQMFFPLWEGRAQVAATLGDLSDDQSVADYLKENPARITIRRKLRVVLFRDAAEYQQTLGRDVPGIERSTGFYSDENQTTFLYAAETDDAATRRHELVHQLFREATRSGLGKAMPGEEAEFWLIEGIAGYFESLLITGSTATLGGWDSSRLQFARYRILANRDSMPMTELRADGRLAAQGRSDLARWYAHAIAHTHRLMDSGQSDGRAWVYHRLADLYAIKMDMAPGELADDAERRLKSFLTIDDQTLRQNRVTRPLQQLCLSGCELTSEGLQLIPPSQYQWLDLSRLPLSSSDLRRIGDPTSLVQLSLEATKIDPAIRDWLASAKNLEELDLSWTAVDDSVVASIAGAKNLNTLWLTGTAVTDEAVDAIAGLPNLRMVDVQRSKVSEAGLARLRKARPNLKINPLELRLQ